MKIMTKTLPFLNILIVLACLSSNSQAATVADIFNNGTIYGDVGSNYYQQNKDDGDQEFGNLFLHLNGETGEIQGFNISVGFTALAEVLEDNDGDADGAHGELLNLAYIRHTQKYFTLTLGRQEIDLEWVGDYHEAITLESSTMDNLTFTALMSRSLAVADPDEVSDKFEVLRDSKGDKTIGYAIDVKYDVLGNYILNSYVYGIGDLFIGYGLRADYVADALGATLHYAESNEVDSGLDDGNITHGELRSSIGDLSLVGGAIITDGKSGAASLPSVGDNISPLEDGNYVYDADATTWYAGAEFALEKLSLVALYADTKYGSSTERELNIIAGYDIVENLAVEALFVDVGAEDSSDDYTRVQFIITFTF